ncbi:MAG: helix-turn-helix domain-containing protein [Reichenbachiella sp.]
MGTQIVVSEKNLDLYTFNKIAKSWDVDFVKLEKGIFVGELTQLIGSRFQISHANFNLKVKQEGESPEGVWTFAFINDTKIHWRNYNIQPHSIVIYAPGSTINAISWAGFEVYTYSIPEVLIAEISQQKKYQSVLELLATLEVVEVNEASWLALRTVLSEQIQMNWSMFNQEENDRHTKALTDNFPFRILDVILESKHSKSYVSNMSRLELLVRVEGLIYEKIEDAITIKELTQSIDSSERTLLYSFKKRYGIGPKAYLKILRLNKVHHELRGNDDCASIASLARESGFWHMGQFSKDYNDFYGQLPSKTKANI